MAATSAKRVATVIVIRIVYCGEGIAMENDCGRLILILEDISTQGWRVFIFQEWPGSFENEKDHENNRTRTG